MNPADLEHARAMQPDATPRPSTPGKQVDRVVKLFPDKDRIEAIKATPIKLMIGHPPEQREVTVYPMNPKQVIAAFGLIRELLLPIIGVVTRSERGETISVPELLEAFGTNVDKLPILVYHILQRGNAISQDWIDEHLDLILDLQLILPVFLTQNGLGKLFGGAGKDVPSSEEEASPNGRQTHRLTEESPKPSTGPADTTLGSPTLFGSG